MFDGENEKIREGGLPMVAATSHRDGPDSARTLVIFPVLQRHSCLWAWGRRRQGQQAAGQNGGDTQTADQVGNFAE